MFSVLDQVPIQPEMVTSFRDAQGDMPADETPAWSSSVGYALGAEVHRVETQTVYRKKSEISSATPPENDAEIWQAMRPTNRAMMFDLYRSTQTVAQNELTVVLRPKQFVNCIWVGGVQATEISITVRAAPGGDVMYEGTELLDRAGRTDWESYFMAIPRLGDEHLVFGIDVSPDPEITVNLKHDGQVRLGTLLVGQLQQLGRTEYGIDSGIVSFSYVKFHEDGTAQFMPRPGAGDVNVRAFVEPHDAARVDSVIKHYDAKPTLWVISTLPQHPNLRLFGLFEGRVSYDNFGQCTAQGRVTGIK